MSGCSANDLRIAAITITNGVTTCTAGTMVQLDLDISIAVGAQERYDIGVFIARDGKSLDVKAAQGGSSQCLVEALPTTAPWTQSNGNICGDVTAATGTQILTLNGGSYLCASDGSGQLVLPGMVTWSQGAASSACPAVLPAGTLASQYVAAGSPSKCNRNSTSTIPPVAVLGSITINKSVAGPDGTFAFTGTGFGGTGAGEPPFSIATAAGSGNHVISGLGTASATYTITEAAGAGYNLTNLACTSGTVTTDLAARTATITLTQTEPNVACTFTNAATGTLTVVKNSPGGDDTFAFTGSAALGAPFNIVTASSAGNHSVAGLPAGNYTVTESAVPAGWIFTGLSCMDSTAGSTFAISGSTVNIAFAAGGTVTCTYTNLRRGSITVNKSTVNGEGTFPFTGTGAGIAPFSIVTAANSGSQTLPGLAPGAGYTVTEAAVAGWDLTGLVCGVGATTDLATRTVTVANLQPGADITCTFTNTQRADLSVTKTNGVGSVNAGATTTYTIVVSNAGPAIADGAIVTDPAAVGLSKIGPIGCTATGAAVCPLAPTIAELEGVGVVIPSFPAGETVTFTVSAAVTATGGSVTNTVEVDPPAGTTDPILANNTASDTDVVNPRADLGITKTNGAARTDTGASTVYTLVVTNAGPSPADGAVLTDPAASGLLKTGAPTCGSATGGAVCPGVISNAALEGAGVAIPTLPSGGSLTFTITALVTATSGSVTNSAAIAAPAGVTDPALANNSASDTDAVGLISDVGVAKSDGVASVGTGATTTYTILVTNSGPSPADGTVVRDPAAAGLTKTGTPTCGAPTGGAVCPAIVSVALLEGAGVVIPTLPAGGSVTFAVSALVTALAGTVTNTALVDAPAGTIDPVPANNSASDTDSVIPAADLAISKTDGIASLNTGAGTTYTVVVTNAGPSAADGAVLRDPAAAGLVKSGAPACVSASGGAVCPILVTNALLEGAGVVIPTLPAGGSLTFTLPATVTATSGSVTNTATVDVLPGTLELVAANNSASDTDIVTPLADLAITKTDGMASVSTGASTTYTLVISNAGPSSADGAIVRDPGAAGLVKGGTPTCVAAGPATCPAVLTNAQLEGAGVAIPVLGAGGSVTITISAVVAALDGSVTNSAAVDAPAGVTDPALANNTASDTNTVQPVADLAISKGSSPSPYVPGAAFSYTIVVTNAGPSNATGARVQDALPAALSSFTWTCAPTGAGASCGSANGAGDIDVLLTLPAGTSATFVVSGILAAGTVGVLTNTATVAAPVGVIDSVPGNNTATDTNPTGPVADLSVTKASSPSPYVPGAAFSYTIVVTNAGPSNAAGARVQDVLPGPLSAFTWTCAPTGGGASCGTANGAGDIDVLLSLPTGTSATFVVSGVVPAGTVGALTNTATVAAPAGVTDPVPGNNTATDTNPTGAVADLSITKASSPSPYVPGAAFSYTIVAANAGPSNAIGARVQDVLPAPLSSFTWTCAPSGAGASCATANSAGDIDALLTLPTGTSATFIVSGIVPPGTVGALTNTATVAAPSGVTDPVPGNNSATNVNPTGAVADLAITKASSPSPYVAGAAFGYTIVVTNAGPSNAAGARVQDVLPGPLSAFTWTCAPTGAGASCGTANGAGDIDVLLTLPTGTSVTFVVSGMIPIGTSGALTNTASVAAPAGLTDPVLANNTATVTNGTLQADLSITITDGIASAAPGDTVSYTVLIANAGPGSGNGAVLEIPAIAGLLKTGAPVCMATSGGAVCPALVTHGLLEGAGVIIAALPAGSSITFVFTGVVTAPAGTVTATAAIDPALAMPDPALANNTATDTFTIIALAAPGAIHAIPTLGEWMLILLGILLAAIGFARLPAKSRHA